MDADGGTVVDAPTALDGWLDPGRRWLVTVEGVDDKVALRWRELPSGAVVETEPGAHAMLMVEAGLGFVSTLTITKRVTVTAFELGARTKIMELDHFAPFDAYANLTSTSSCLRTAPRSAGSTRTRTSLTWLPESSHPTMSGPGSSRWDSPNTAASVSRRACSSHR